MRKYELNEFIEKLNVLFGDICNALKEANEMQSSFNNEYVNNFEKNYDSAEALLIGDIIKIYKKKSGGALIEAINREIEAKKPLLTVRIDEFKKELAAIEDDFQKIKTEKADFLKGYMKVNPELNAEEERLKNLIAVREKELNALKEKIESKGNGVFSSLVNFLGLFFQRREFYKGYKELTAEKAKLLETRQIFLKSKTKKDDFEKNVGRRYNDDLKKAAYLRQSLFKLENDFENTVLEEAVSSVILTVGDKKLLELEPQIKNVKNFIELYAMKKEYEISLKNVSEEIGFLTGIKSGVENILKTLKSLSEQYRQYSSYLKPLAFELNGFIDGFSGCFSELASKIEDDKKLASAPDAFLKIVGPFHQKFLNESAVKRFFEELGIAIESATSKWK
ncbi:MAG: hypothetical protein QMC67_09705 [Candidatus Wallbacteria bacterium]